MIPDAMPTRQMKARFEACVRGYMDACNAGDARRIASYLADDAVHYFPPDMYDGPWRGAGLIGENWARFVAERHSLWTVDSIAIDVDTRVAASEWTHFKRSSGIILRGTEWYEFDKDGKISEIRAYYASPQAETFQRLELSGFDYEARGYGSRA